MGNTGVPLLDLMEISGPTFKFEQGLGSKVLGFWDPRILQSLVLRSWSHFIACYKLDVGSLYDTNVHWWDEKLHIGDIHIGLNGITKLKYHDVDVINLVNKIIKLGWNGGILVLKVLLFHLSLLEIMIILLN